jgi:hypothetical protein
MAFCVKLGTRLALVEVAITHLRVRVELSERFTDSAFETRFHWRSKRQIIVLGRSFGQRLARLVWLVIGLLVARLGRCCSPAWRAFARLLRSIATLLILTADELERFQDYAELVAFLASGLVVPRFSLKASDAKHWASFTKVLTDYFSGLSERRNVNEGRFLLLLACVVFPSAVYRQTDLGNGCAFRCVSKFWISREIPHQCDLVK